MNEVLQDVVRRQKAGEPVGITSVCSAHPLVLRAAIAHACEDGSSVLVEATSNQVDQFGGYTGLRPGEFRDLVWNLSDAAGLPRERVVLGGDHLGPNAWRTLPAEKAMSLAEDLVVAYVEAGYTKIHLDCSMACSGDALPLEDDLVAERAARLAAAAERAAARRISAATPPVYVVGTEVPVPGGAHETIEALAPTSAHAARRTLAAHEAAFAAAGLEQAWERVIALVVQPGVEFDHLHVVDYQRDRTAELRHVLDAMPHTVFEAHSTDYQTVGHLTELVEDHWAVLKVGPGLTFALREALFALAAIEDEIIPAKRRSRLADVVDQVMVGDPRWWAGYYDGDEQAQRVARRYSYSDRMRYYWPAPEISAATDTLLANLSDAGIPLPLLSAHLPQQYWRIRAGAVDPDPTAIVLDRVRDVLRGYGLACNPRRPGSLS